MFAKIPRAIARIREAGLRHFARTTADRAVLTVLRWRYGFAAWHAYSPTSVRNYRVGVAAMVDALALESVVDVGCGLGAVLTRIAASHRHGYDTDPGVIRAARLLHGRSARFSTGSFGDVIEPKIDLLLALNWIHELPPTEVEALVTPLLSRTRYLLLDKVYASSPLAYRHYHDFAFLDERADILATDPCGEAHRSFVLYRMRR